MGCLRRFGDAGREGDGGGSRADGRPELAAENAAELGVVGKVFGRRACGSGVAWLTAYCMVSRMMIILLQHLGLPARV
jgi:hypothetical protein